MVGKRRINDRMNKRKKEIGQIINDRKVAMVSAKCEADEKTLVEQCEVSLILDSYDEIFSSFDPRPYSQRALSDDFIEEAKRATRELSPDKLQLRFMIPNDMRKPDYEVMIRRRLHEHFKKHYDNLLKEKKNVVNKGILAALLGFGLMIVAASISTFYGSDFLLHLIKVIIDPAGWFAMWYGFDLILYTVKDEEKERDFHRKMSKADINFESY